LKIATTQENKEMIPKVNARNMRRIELYAMHSGKTASAVLNGALNYWHDMFGEIILEEMIKRNGSMRKKRA
jgi:hypothetical protein